ncbi:sulfur transporter [Salsuginibacillus halophilus]|uniref:Sulfur transporter n=1 Tax=Salsuginibacillus halophilus TaxID=517424 RepID=A0A2P8HWI8_9BACI|nr:sulfur transporter [Salsuginibacillus halophilus]
MPSFGSVSLAEDTGLGFLGAWALQAFIFAAVIVITLVYQKKKRPPEVTAIPTESGIRRLFRGSWPLWIAALLLALLNAVTLMVRGEPWGITSAFALWGTKVIEFFGVDAASWGFWADNQEPLQQSVFLDSTSVMNFGIITGAFIASAAGGLFALKKVPMKTAAASLIGGLMMGYGARLAFGCNIGAYFGGIASFSIHGWLWAVMALAGSFLALWLRPKFGLSVPNKKDKTIS